MATSGKIFEAMVSYYSTLAYRTLALMRRTQQDIRTEQLDWKSLASRSLSLWFDAASGCYSAMALAGVPQVPTLGISLRHGQVDRKTLTVSVPGSSEPELTPLYSLDGKSELEPKRLSIEVGAQRDEITVSFNPGKVPKGIYQGFITIDDQLLARLVVCVSEDVTIPEPRRPNGKGNGAPRGAKRGGKNSGKSGKRKR